MDVGDLVGGRTPEGAGIDSGRDSVGGCCWFREMDGKPDARGSWHFQLVGKNINTWQGTEADGVLSWNFKSVAVLAQPFIINMEEYRN